MKRKQVIALILSAALAVSVAAPVMAAEPAEDLAQSGVVQEIPDEKSESLASDTEHAKEADAKTVPEADRQKEETKADDLEKWNPVITEEELEDSKESLMGLLDKDGLMDRYDKLPAEAKAGLDSTAAEYMHAAFDENVDNFEQSLAYMEGVIGALELGTELDPYLDQLMDEIVESIDQLRHYLITVEQWYQDENIDVNFVTQQWETIIKDLNAYSTWYAPLFTADYVKTVSSYYEKLNAVEITDENAVDIYEQLMDADKVLGQADKNINFSYRDQAKEIIAHYQDFLALAPEGMADEFAFRFLTGTDTPDKYVFTYGNVVDKYLPQVQAELASLEDAFSIGAYYSFYEETWGNLNNLWTALANAIEQDALKQSEEIDVYGYEGSEKAEYERAAVVFQAALEDREYAQLVTAAKDMQAALKEYNEAAKLALEEAKDQLPGLLDQLMVLMTELEVNGAYYEDMYYQEVAAQIGAVSDALSDLPAVTDIEALKLVNSVNGTLKKQASSYSEKLDVLMEQCESLNAAIADIFAYASDGVKETDNYKDAAALWKAFADKVSKERNAYDAGAVVDITGLLKAYDNMAADAGSEEGMIQTAARAILDAAVKAGQELYKQEAAKEHSKEALEAYKTALDAAVKLQSSWDPSNVSDVLKGLADAQEVLLNDKAGTEKPSDHQQKPSDITEDPVDTGKKTEGKDTTSSGNVPKTGDAAAAGILAMMAASGLGGAAGLRRRKKD
ncbi:Uncharacterised protein [uncultured Roseburia sp.]|uniref:Heat shock 70 family protein n=1 Tax=Brotonthovivens ammoniilytica TaxID=2981725 RepID=A0ABT2TJU0_9FIRM|nr:LPXTG cell wall anchor domain-containing protein [Brotonthovivens ammoniilytica]MCU6762372.1 heat shock 70 family protein [Brotonthovivens ammoniilytica]SCI69645.1 Uncharacterised protein [uncultured Roseburia sp.]